MTDKWKRQFLPAVMAVITVFTVFPFLETMSRLYGRSVSAVEWHGVEVVTSTVNPGGVLEMIYSATINKQCPSDLRGFLVANDGSIPVRFPTVAGGYTRPSEDPVDIRVKVKIPEESDPGLAPLTDGRYLYQTAITRYCPDGVEYDNKVPDVPFYLEVTSINK